MANSNQIREFILTDHGVELREVYVGTRGVLTGSARIAQESIETAEVLTREHDIEQKTLEIERKRKAMEARISSLRSEFELEKSETIRVIEAEREMLKRSAQDKVEMAVSRKADVEKVKKKNLKKELKGEN
jgi:circadian clock protein KaiC